MNGRIYDPLLGRFLSADTFVQDAGDLQAYNRYSYVRNNPTSLNDPSGHFWSALITVGFAAYDTYNYATGKTTGAEYAKNMALNGAALVADVATVGQGGGLAVRAANAGIRIAKAVDKANDVYETAQTVVSVGNAVVNGDTAEIGKAVVTAAVEKVVGGGKGKHDVDLNTNSVKAKKLDGVDASAAAVKPGDRGTYTDLKNQKRANGETEPVHMHEMPSYAAKKEAFKKEHGRDPTTAEEKKMVRDAGVTEAVTPEVHSQTSTYKGNNTKETIAKDAADLAEAQKRNEEELRRLKEKQ